LIRGAVVPVRLNKFLSRQGLASRREADRWIAAGRVAVNGLVVQDLGSKIEEGRDRVAVDGRPVRTGRTQVYLMLNKPSGCLVTRNDPEGRPTVMDLLPRLKESVFPVGRLDFDSEGLLLLTNDGEMAYRLTHPKFEIRKTYAVTVKGELTDAEAARLEQGVSIRGRRTAPGRVRIFERGARRSLVQVEIHEGRKHEVRLMMESVGHPVQALKRVAYAGLSLAPLARGRWRHLRKDEVAGLRRLTGLG
jgi:pseudouridine synthase